MAYFGTLLSVLSNNGQKFNKQYFNNIAQNLKTAGKNLWSNDHNERCHGILAMIVKKNCRRCKIQWGCMLRIFLTLLMEIASSQLAILNDQLSILEDTEPQL